MDKKTTVHVAAEAAVLTALTLYLVNRVAALEQRVTTLEKEIIVVAKKEAKVEQTHGTALRSLLEGGIRRAATTEVPPPHVHSHPHVHNHPPQVSHSHVQKKVTFGDDPEEVDEELMEQEFGDSEQEESSESPPTRKKSSSKSKGRTRIKVTSAPPRRGQKGKDMDDVKAKAAAMQKAAEGDN
uniref:Uncharacterized protein n=1 Tax=viral metagenome TaxID=1070528 RepID=A0A6C0CIG5_9ZZZZ